jgi:hypothetical protein
VEFQALEAVTSMYQNLFVAYRAIVQKPLRYFLQNVNKFSKVNFYSAIVLVRNMRENYSFLPVSQDGGCDKAMER